MLTCAKVNLFLRVLDKRQDGYHELETIFWPLANLCDHIQVSLRPRGGIDIKCDAPGVPTDRRNICWKAADAFNNAIGRDLSPLISITKNIPVAAGLGGGSSDAAATLLELRRLACPDMSMESLHAIAAQIGADVPFFLNPVPSLATGIGDILSPILFKSQPGLFLVNPGFPIPASWAYKHWKDAAGSPPANSAVLLNAISSGDWAAAADLAHNDLELCAFKKFPVLSLIKELMQELGIRNVHISGSGPTLFGFTDKDTNHNASSIIQEQFSGLARCYTNPAGE